MKRKPSTWGVINLCCSIFNFGEYIIEQRTLPLVLAVICLTLAVVYWND
jgi:hypothetical protein